MFKIFLSVVVTTFLFFLWRYYYIQFLEERKHNPEYALTTIVQASADVERLPATYLAELLSLSSDHPTSYYHFDQKGAEKRLQEHPLFKEVFLRALFPHTVYIEYRLRKPVALLYELPGFGIDEEGVFFQMTPFFTPKKLPRLIFGLKEMPQGKIDMKESLQILDFAALYPELGLTLVDFSLAKEKIVLFNHHLLRMGDNPLQALHHYRKLLPRLPQKAFIDLRIPSLAFTY